MTSTTETNPRLDRLDRRMWLEAYDGKCSHCGPHRSENRRGGRRNGRKNRATK